MGFGAPQKPTRLNQAQITQSVYGYPVPVVMGTARIQQSLLWEDGFGAQSVAIQGGKGGGKGGTEYLYYVDVIAALCNGPILGIGDVWSNSSWLGLPSAAETYTIASPGIYTPSNAPAVATSSNNLINDVGVAFHVPYSGTYNDLNAPSSTVLSGTHFSSLIKVPYGTTLTSGTYSFNPNSIGTFTLTSVANASGGNTVYTGTITGGGSNAFAGYTFVIAGYTNAANNGSFVCASSTATTLTLQNASGIAETHAATATEPGNTYHFDATHDVGKTLTLNYSFYLPNITQDETDIVPAGQSIHIGGSLQFLTDLGVVYSTGPNNGVRLQAVNHTPTVAGTYQLANNNGHGVDYKFAAGDINAQVRITWITQDQSLVPQGQTRSLNFQLFEGTQGQSVWSLLTSKYPGSAVGYSNTAYAAYHPMSLGTSGQISNNTFEVVTPDMYGGGILDCNPIQCIGQVLTNQQWGLGAGITPFPTSVMDNGSSGTWGSAPATPGTAQGGPTAWNWFAANSFFISPLIDSQDTAASLIGKWLEAGMCAAFYSEGLLKFVSYGDTSCAAYGCTWTAPTAYVAALDDTCYVGKEGEDPVKITRSAPQDAMNVVRVQWNNRSNQYSPEITQESDQASINKWGERREDPLNWDFIHTLTAATFAANMRVKHNVYIRNTYEFTLPFTYSYLEPMDLLEISTQSVWGNIGNTNLGLVNQPVRITKIVDDPKTGLAITAEDYPWGAHLPTIFNKGISAANVVSNAYAHPGNVEVVMFEATSRATGFSGNEIWIGVVGTSSNYGSTNIWVSRDNTNFEQVGTIQAPARLGVLGSTFASGSDPDTTHSLVIDLAENCGALEAGSTADADNKVTLCFVDGEYIAYSAMALSGQQQYTANGYIRRGLFGTTISSHAAGSLFMRMDQSIFKYQYDPTWAGQTLYFKFQPVNAFGNSATPLANLGSQAFTVPGVNPGTIDAASGLVIPYSQSSNNPVIQNANFEMTGLPVPGWKAISGTTTVAPITSGLTQAYETSSPASGTQSLKLTATSAFMGLQSTSLIAVQPSDVWKMSGAVNNYSNGAGTANLCFYCMDKIGTRTGFLSLSSSTNDSTWHSVSGSFTVPANTVYAFIYCRVDSIGSAGFDNIQLVRVSSMDSEVSDGGSFVRLLASHAVNNVAYNFRGIWASGTTYLQGDEVVYGQSYWVALAGSTNSAPNTGNANWQVVGSYSGYQGAWSSSTAYVAGAEVTYSGNYWVCVTANTNSAPSTSNANWQVAGPSNLDNIADGGVYLRTSYIAGDALLDNGNFEASTTILPPPGYTIYANTPTLAYDTTTQYSGSQSIKITSPAGGGGGILPIKQVLCRQGDTFFASVRAKKISGSGAADLSISFRSANGTGIGGSDVTTTSSSWTLISNTQTAPAGTVYATFEIYANAANTTVEFDEHYIRCVRNLDTEVMDGPNYGRVNNTALTGNSIDPSKSGVLMKGSIAPTLSGGFSYSSSATAMTISWDSNMALYRADGTSTNIGGGTQPISGLVQNTIYSFFPYWDEASSTLKWVGSEVTTPSIVGVTFNGTNQEVTTATQFSLAAAFSLEGWFKLTSTSTSNLGIVTFATPQTGGFTTSMAGIYLNNNGLLKCYIENSGNITTSVAPATAYNDGQWHHVVSTFSGGTLTCYADGIQISQISGLGAINTTASWIRIAHGNTGVFFPGTISRVAYYNTALNIGQVSNHFQASAMSISTYDSSVATDTPTYYWKLVETSGTSAADSAGSNTGTYLNAPTLNQSSLIMAPDGSPAIAWSANPLLVQQAQTLQGRSPLSTGPLSFTTPATGGTGGGGSGGTGSGSGGTGYGGGRGCFSGNTRVVTKRGNIAIRDVRIGDFVLTAKATWRLVAGLLVHEPEHREMRNMGDDELVTPNHYVFLGNVKTPAGEIFEDVVDYHEAVFNLSVLTDVEIERSYTLGNGHVVSNFKLA